MDAGRLPEAVREFQIGIERGARWANLNLGNAFEALRDWDAAAQAFAAAVAVGELSARLNLANILAHRLFRRDEARFHYEQAWREGDPAAAVGLGMLAEQEGDLAAAAEWFGIAVERNLPQARWRLAYVLNELGDLDTAMRLLTQAELDGEPGARVTRALVLRKRGSAEEAERHLRTAIAEGDEGASLFLADLLAEKGQYDEARVWFERACAADGDAWLDYALFLEETSTDPQDSVRAYQRGIESGDFRGHYNLAVRLAELGQWDEAEAAYGRAQASGDPKATAPFTVWRERVG